ncbi:hypothetical protein ABIB56_003322 [Glaciihabitans sp. UYNi722]
MRRLGNKATIVLVVVAVVLVGAAVVAGLLQ